MRKLRHAMDNHGFWELDMETPVTMEGTARPVPSHPLPLGLSRGVRLSRPKQHEFMHRFMASPFVPSYTPRRGLAMDHVHTFHLRNNWSASLMEKFHVRDFLDGMKKEFGGQQNGPPPKGLLWLRRIGKQFVDACSVGIGSEFLITPDSTLLLETYNDDEKKPNRTKAVFQHKFPHHCLRLEAAWPGLFVDNDGSYWDVPSFMCVDLSSDSSDSSSSYHICAHNGGNAYNHINGKASEAPPPPGLLPGLSAKAAFSLRKTLDIWRKKDGKVKLVQPYDMFHSDPNVSVTGIIGSVVSASVSDHLKTFATEDRIKPFKLLNLHAKEYNASISADFFGSISFNMQHGNFQRLFFDLSRLGIRFDFPSASASLESIEKVAHDLYTSRILNKDAVNTICPKTTLSLQQQIAGPVSFRAESSVEFDLNKFGSCAIVNDTIFGIEYAMQVLGSARATAWYSTKSKEAMVELRFFEY